MLTNNDIQSTVVKSGYCTLPMNRKVSIKCTQLFFLGKKLFNYSLQMYHKNCSRR